MGITDLPPPASSKLQILLDPLVDLQPSSPGYNNNNNPQPSQPIPTPRRSLRTRADTLAHSRSRDASPSILAAHRGSFSKDRIMDASRASPLFNAVFDRMGSLRRERRGSLDTWGARVSENPWGANPSGAPLGERRISRSTMSLIDAKNQLMNDHMNTTRDHMNASRDVHSSREHVHASQEHVNAVWAKKLEEEKEKLAEAARRLAAKQKEKEMEGRREEDRRLREKTARGNQIEIPEELPVVEVMILGDSGVGKTSFAIQFTEETFMADFVSTVGIDFKSTDIEVDGQRYKVHCWDTAGQEKYRTLSAMNFLFRRINAIILMYDVCSQTSFQNVHHWSTSIESSCPNSVAKILVGNKSDVPDALKQVDSIHGRRLAKEMDIPFLEASVLQNKNVREAFERVIGDYILRKPGEEEDDAKHDPRSSNTTTPHRHIRHRLFGTGSRKEKDNNKGQQKQQRQQKQQQKQQQMQHHSGENWAANQLERYNSIIKLHIPNEKNKKACC